MLWFRAHTYHTNSLIKTFHSALSLCSVLHGQSSHPTASRHTGLCRRESECRRRPRPLQTLIPVKLGPSAWSVNVLRQMNVTVWLRACPHMMLWSRLAQESNVIGKCSRVPARLNTLLSCFQEGMKQPFPPPPPNKQPCRGSHLASFCYVSPCHSASSTPYRLPYRSQLQLASSFSGYVILMRKLPTPQLTAHANGPDYATSWDPV